MGTHPRDAAMRALLIGVVSCSTPSATSALPLLTPSNADTAFTQISLLTPSAGSGYVTNVGHAIWPSLLDNAAMVRPIGGSDSILIASTRLHGVSINLDGSVTYSLPAGVFANRVGTIVTANDWADPGDGTFPVLTATFTFSDGRQWGSGTALDVPTNSGKALNLVYQVRNWSNQVMSTRPDFVMPPADPRVFELYGGPASGAGDSVFCDLQTFDLPDSLRSAQLSSVTLSSHSQVFGFPITSTTALISGLVVWPHFRLSNRLGDTLGVLRQDVGAWADSAYGGYYHQGVLLGTDGTIRENGCSLVCAAMLHNYFRVDPVAMTPDHLNHWLQTHKGYKRYGALEIDSLVGQGKGDVVRFSLVSDGAPWRLGDRAVVEIQDFQPAFEIQVNQLFPGAPPTGRGTITHAFQAVAGSPVRAYKRGDMNLTIASLGRSLNSTNPWTFDSTANSARRPSRPRSP